MTKITLPRSNLTHPSPSLMAIVSVRHQNFRRGEERAKVFASPLPTPLPSPLPTPASSPSASPPITEKLLFVQRRLGNPHKAARSVLDEEIATNTGLEVPTQPACNICSSPNFWTSAAWKRVIYVNRLLQLFRYVPREQLTIPDFVFQHDLEVNGGKDVIEDPRTRCVWKTIGKSYTDGVCN